MEILANAGKPVNARLWTRDAVRLVGVEHEIVLLPGVDQALDHLNGVLHMNIVVDGAVDFQQMAMQVIGEIYRRAFLVGSFIFREQATVALGVDGVVVMPVGDWSYGGYMTLYALTHSERHVAAVAPAPPGQAIAIQLRKFLQR